MEQKKTTRKLGKGVLSLEDLLPNINAVDSDWDSILAGNFEDYLSEGTLSEAEKPKMEATNNIMPLKSEKKISNKPPVFRIRKMNDCCICYVRIHFEQDEAYLACCGRRDIHKECLRLIQTRTLDGSDPNEWKCPLCKGKAENQVFGNAYCFRKRNQRDYYEDRDYE